MSKNDFLTKARDRPALSSFLLGSLSVFALPPFGLWITLFLTLPAFLWLLQSCSTAKQSFWSGWGFGFGYFLFGLFWIANALLKDAQSYWWLIPFAVCGIPAVLAIYHGLASVFAVRLSKKNPVTLWLSFSFTIALAEYLRGHLFTGFPWNSFASIWSETFMLQTAAFVGENGLSLITIILASSSFLLTIRPLKPQHHTIIGFCILIFICLAILGQLRTNSSVKYGATNIRIVQPNITQVEKWKPEFITRNQNILLELSRGKSKKTDQTIIIWPETALTIGQARDPLFSKLLTDILRQENALLLTGILRYDSDVGKTRYYNSLSAIKPTGELHNSYNKSHLVPFGEYVPFQQYIPFGPVVNFSGFQSGDGNKTIKIGDYPSYSPLVCYEIIFSGKVSDTENRPALLVNATNDAWYGHSPGPYQHFATARMRAVEEGLPVIRVANTGISAVLDPFGRTTSRIAYGERGRTDSPLPTAIDPTLFVQYGNKFFWIMLILLVLGVAFCRNRKI